MNNYWHQKTISDIFKVLKTSELGLSKNKIGLRLSEYGPNKLPEGKVTSLFEIFLNQFKSPLIYILLVASGIVFYLGETVDGTVILSVLLFNAIVGTIQEGRAQNTLLALKRFVETKSTVVRDDKEIIISDTEIVPGDIVILSEGEKVPADSRIIFSNNLQVDESAMTGESIPVLKNIGILQSKDLSTSDQVNMVFKGTNVVSGNGKVVVVETGANTVIGKIAQQITTIETDVPLKTNIKNLSRIIIITVGIISTILFIYGISINTPAKEMFITVVSLAVSVIPEGLPIVVTLILATGAWRMSKRNALVKKLQAVEALGQAQIIAVDKTGTITRNELIIKKIFVGGETFSVGGIGYEPKGTISHNGKSINPKENPDIALVGKIASYSASARVMFSTEENTWKIAGDPTEASMLVLSQKIGLHKDLLEKEEPIIEEMPFDYKLKYHALVYGEKKKNLIAVGAPEVILELCTKIWKNGKANYLKNSDKDEIVATFEKMSQEGLRVIAFAEKINTKDSLSPEKVSGLCFIGFFGMKDALRSEVSKAMQKSISAGIRVVMITGDHKITAQSIAKEAGIYRDGDLVLTGNDIDNMTEFQLVEKLGKTSVFARVNPEHKLLIIKAFQKRGEIVAMTGDGVNDAPSLVAADLGVAMGKTGTEVAKEASDIVLLDDNFGSIVSAVEEGRSIYKTIKKVILYLFSTSLGEVFAISGALFLGYPLPILATQIIWLNFVTDGFLDISLAMEPKEKNLLRDNFEKPNKYLVDKKMLVRMVLMALPMAIGTLILFKHNYPLDIAKAWTISLTLLAAFQWFNAWNCRSEKQSIFKMSFWSNKFLVGATALVILLQVFAIYSPFMNKFLSTTPLSFFDWLIIIPIAFSVVVVEELRKYYVRSKKV